MEDHQKANVDRLLFIDWLRVLATFAVFFYHSGRFFDNDGWHIKYWKSYTGMSLFTGFINQWLMPLFFLLSAVSIHYSLQFRSPRKFAFERVKRILFPFIFGIFILIPPQVYLERLTHMQFNGSFFQFLPHYFEGFYGFGGNFAWIGLHLWYLLFLFIYSLLMLPLFWRWSKKPDGALGEFWGRIASSKPGIIYFFAIPMMVLEAAIDPWSVLGGEDMGGWNLLIYLAVFIMGFFTLPTPAIREAMRRQRKVSLMIGVITASTLAILVLTKGNPGEHGFCLVCFSILRAFNSWVWIVTILGFGIQNLNFKNRFLEYSSEASLPFYIIHQTVILIVGYFVLNWRIPMLIKYGLIAIISFIVILGFYEFMIRRWNGMRFLFGMKHKNRDLSSVTKMQATK